MEIFLGIICVLLAGIGTGTMAWPLKAVRTYQFEQLWPLGMFVGLFVIPWVITLTCIPNALAAYATVDPAVLIKSNLFAMAWGICNVMFGICIVRIGAALAGAMLTSIGLSIGLGTFSSNAINIIVTFKFKTDYHSCLTKTNKTHISLSRARNLSSLSP